MKSYLVPVTASLAFLQTDRFLQWHRSITNSIGGKRTEIVCDWFWEQNKAWRAENHCPGSAVKQIHVIPSCRCMPSNQQAFGVIVMAPDLACSSKNGQTGIKQPDNGPSKINWYACSVSERRQKIRGLFSDLRD